MRWNCKAAKCGSCGAEVNGKPRLMCKTRLDDLPADRPSRVAPAARVPDHPRPRQRRLVELRGEQAHPAVHAEAGRRLARCSRRTSTGSQEFRKCIECFLCQNVCHVLRDHHAQEPLLRPALPRPHRGARDAPARHRRPHRAREGRGGHRPLQHHEVLHGGLPGGDQDHRQRDHPAEGARRRPALRPAVRPRPQARSASRPGRR